MAKVSIQIETTNIDGSKKQKSLTDINPQATSTQLVQFAQSLVALTNQTYSATYRIEKINCDTENATNP